MKLSIKILLTAVIIFVYFFSIAYFFLYFEGRNFITRQLENITGKQVEIRNFNLVVPFNLVVKNLVIKDALKIEEARISPSIFSLLFGRIAFNSIKIKNPQITYERKVVVAADSNEKLPLPESAAIDEQNTQPAQKNQTSSAFNTTDKQGKPVIRLVIKSLRIRNGKINFADHTVGPEGIHITVKDLNFSLNNFYAFKYPAVTSFELTAAIPWKEGTAEGRIAIEGWTNFYKRDMLASLRIKDIDGIYLYPYYSRWVDLEKARIEKATLNFSSDIGGLNNNVNADCHLELMNIVRKARPEGEPQEKAARITDAVLDIFRSLNEGKIVLNFNIKTKMDNPQFGFSTIQSAFENKLTQARRGSATTIDNVLGMPAKVVEGTFKAGTDLTTAVISGTINAGKEMAKAVGDSFKKEKPEDKKEEKKE